MLRLLKGEDLDTLSRQLKVTAATLSEWRDVFPANGLAGLMRREVDGRNGKIAALEKVLAETAPGLSVSLQRIVPLVRVCELAVEARVLGIAHLAERYAQMSQDVELVEQDRGLWGVPAGRVAKRFPHGHHRQADFPGPLFAEKAIEPVHARLAAISAAEPDRSVLLQVAHHDALLVSLAHRDLVDAAGKALVLNG